MTVRGLTDAEFFAWHTMPVPECGCLLWIGPLTALGYGRWLRGEIESAHRKSWKMHRGEIGDFHVLHKCDVRCCVEPTHLFLGTQVDNIADMVAKGRQKSGARFGESNCRSKLNDTAVAEIREIYSRGGHTLEDLALACGVSKMTISRAVNRISWRHI